MTAALLANPRRAAADAKPTGATPRRATDLVGSAALAERVRTLTTQLAQAPVEQTCALPAVGRWLAKGEIGMSKQSAWLLLLAGSLGGCAFEASAALEEDEVAELADGLVKNALTPLQEAKVLKLIDDICGDTWCEGDHNFSFDRLQCRPACGERAGSCKLTLRIFSHDTDLETGPTHLQSCTTRGFTGIESLVQTSGGYESLQPAYYAALTECIGRIEASSVQAMGR